jgi:hypothetical protein
MKYVEHSCAFPEGTHGRQFSDDVTDHPYYIKYSNENQMFRKYIDSKKWQVIAYGK